MREIKFRVWDEDRLEFLPQKSVAIIADGVYVLEICPLTGKIYRIIKNCIISQYTGFVDKNNIEIYNQDLVKINGLGIYEVDCDMIWGFCLIDRKGNVIEYSKNNNLLHDVKVIGNIYQNPELLRK